MKKYKNTFDINQRGASISINNSTGRESFQISHRSGSNIHINNLVNSEFAYNNKQLYVIHDFFENVSNDKFSTISGNNTIKTGKNLYKITGYNNISEIEELQKWKDSYEPIAKANSIFRIARGGFGYPNGDATPISGSREPNPVLSGVIPAVNNDFESYLAAPLRSSQIDEVTTYLKVNPRGIQTPAAEISPTVLDIELGCGPPGTQAPGVLEFGAEKSAATEDGDWKTPQSPHDPSGTVGVGKDEGVAPATCKDEGVAPATSGDKSYTCDIRFNYKKIPLWPKKTESFSVECGTTTLGVNIITTFTSTLVLNERYSGQFGDEITITKRHKFEQVGATFNDFPSIRIDPKGRSQPFEIAVGPNCTFKNHDYQPHIEEVDNSSNFPCGNDIKIIGNRMSRKVGSGGIDLKTTGVMEFGAAKLQMSASKVFISSNHGITLASDAEVELQSKKSIVLRTNRQVYVESSLGVKSNAVIGGGLLVEGELYCHHITAPVEIQQTEDTHVFGKFATNLDRALIIGEVEIFGNWFNVYAKASHDLIYNYPHSHHFKNIPIRVVRSNKDLRVAAMSENINRHGAYAYSLPQAHERKPIIDFTEDE